MTNEHDLMTQAAEPQHATSDYTPKPQTTQKQAQKQAQANASEPKGESASEDEPKNETASEPATKKGKGFGDLGLSPLLQKTIKEVGYETPTAVQEVAIPVILKRKDVIAIAQTGTGKTAAFTLPVIDLLSDGRSRARMPRALILSPTRELAQQTAENFALYGKHHKLVHALLIGGVSMEKQSRILKRGVDVLIVTPGRLLDHFDRGRILLNAAEFLVIDEADRMLDMGFIPDIEKIMKLLPPKKQILLFSATMAAPIEKLANKFMTKPERIALAVTGSAAKTITQALVWTQPEEKMSLLEEYLKTVEDNAIIFCNRKRDVEKVYRSLNQRHFKAAQLHGDMSQSKRNDVLKKFKAKGLPILVASNVAARGLDVANISNVVNYDVPQNAEDYVHRIGRTGRAGKKGLAWTLAVDKEGAYIKAIETLMGISIPVAGGVAPKGRSRGNASGRPKNNNNKSRRRRY